MGVAKRKMERNSFFLEKETVFWDVVTSKADHKMGSFQYLLFNFRQYGKNGQLSSNFV